MRNISRIVLHTSATVQSATISSIKNYWKETLGWKSVGYHFIVEADGKITMLAPLNSITNGVRGYNSDSIHICWIGGKDVDDRTDAQKVSLRGVVATMKAMYPNAEILGHRDLSPDLNGDGEITPNEWVKLCPQFDAKSEYKNLM